jgi:hypothetical protein
MIFLSLLDLQSKKIIVDFKKEVLIKNLMRKIRKKNVKEKKVEIILFILMMKALRKPKFLFQIGIQVKNQVQIKRMKLSQVKNLKLANKALKLLILNHKSPKIYCFQLISHCPKNLWHHKELKKSKISIQKLKRKSQY